MALIYLSKPSAFCCDRGIRCGVTALTSDHRAPWSGKRKEGTPGQEKIGQNQRNAAHKSPQDKQVETAENLEQEKTPKILRGRPVLIFFLPPPNGPILFTRLVLTNRWRPPETGRHLHTMGPKRPLVPALFFRLEPHIKNHFLPSCDLVVGVHLGAAAFLAWPSLADCRTKK